MLDFRCFVVLAPAGVAPTGVAPAGVDLGPVLDAQAESATHAMRTDALRLRRTRTMRSFIGVFSRPELQGLWVS